MQKASRPLGRWQSGVFPLAALLVAVADQLSKLWVRSNLAEGQLLFEIGFFRITNIHNTGASFGLFRDQTLLLTIFGIVGIVVLLLYALFIYRRFPLLNNMLGKIVLGLVLGGTIGNLIDRLRFGYVTDFIDFTFWPAFNIADSAIVIGVILFTYSLYSLFKAGKY